MNISAFLSVDLMMKLHRQYVSSFFFFIRPFPKKDLSLIRTLIQLVDIEIYLHYFMTVKGQYFFPKTNQIIRIKHSLAAHYCTRKSEQLSQRII